MGAKKNPIQAVASVAKGLVESGMTTATGGIYNPETGTIKTGADQLTNVGSAVTGGMVMKELQPKPPGMPTAEDPVEQAKRAQAEAESKVAAQLGQGNKGLASTITGGSLSTDTSILKKKKLLGE